MMASYIQALSGGILIGISATMMLRLNEKSQVSVGSLKEFCLMRLKKLAAGKFFSYLDSYLEGLCCSASIRKLW